MSLLDFLFVPTIVLLAVVAPLWIVAHYFTQWRRAKSLSGEDEKLLQELWETAAKMEERIDTLERIIEPDAPDWGKQE